MRTLRMFTQAFTAKFSNARKQRAMSTKRKRNPSLGNCTMDV